MKSRRLTEEEKQLAIQLYEKTNRSYEEVGKIFGVKKQSILYLVKKAGVMKKWSAENVARQILREEETQTTGL